MPSELRDPAVERENRAAKFLAKVMSQKGLSQSALAKLVGCAQPEIGRLLGGKDRRAITERWAKRLAPALGKHWLEIFEGEDYAFPSPGEGELLATLRGMNEDDRRTAYRLIEGLASTGKSR